MRPWLQGYLSGAPVSVLYLLGMRLRGTPIRLVMDAYQSLVHNNTIVDAKKVESVYIANRHRVVGTVDLINLVKESVAKDAAQQQ